jgi:hypothetical protein
MHIFQSEECPLDLTTTSTFFINRVIWILFQNYTCTHMESRYVWILLKQNHAHIQIPAHLSLQHRYLPLHQQQHIISNKLSSITE